MASSFGYKLVSRGLPGFNVHPARNMDELADRMVRVLEQGGEARAAFVCTSLTSDRDMTAAEQAELVALVTERLA